MELFQDSPKKIGSSQKNVPITVSALDILILVREAEKIYHGNLNQKYLIIFRINSFLGV